MEIKLALNTGCLVNRYVTPEQWIPYLSDEIGVKSVQFTADMLNPGMPKELLEPIAMRTKKIADDFGVEICSTFTGAFTRLNHFSHPDKSIRNYWLNWFKGFVDLSVMLGSKNLGSHFGILSVADDQSAENRERRFSENLQYWKEVADYAQSQGLDFLTWEPMSISREYGENIAEIHRIHKRIKEQDFAIPMELCLDVDHGDVSSINPDDTNPYVYLEQFATISPVVHLKQSYSNKGGHWPFTEQHNDQGIIRADKVLNTLERNGCKETILVLEISVKERTPQERSMTDDLKQSVSYWQHHCSQFMNKEALV